LLKALPGGSALAVLVALSSMLGCGSAEESFDESAQLGAHAEKLVNSVDPSSPEFKGYSPVNAPSTAVGDPTFCTANVSHSYAMFTRDTSNFIQGQSTPGVGPGSAWAKYGSGPNPRQLGGRPACAFLSNSPNGSNSYPFILLAKGAVAPNNVSDKRLFWSQGQWTLPTSIGNPPPAPTASTPFAPIDTSANAPQFQTNGNPAAAMHNGQLVVVYLGDDGQLLGNYWTGNGFSATLVHPTLPTGWTGVGTPTIAFAGGWAQKFVIFIRASYRGLTTGVFETFFENNRFAGAAGGPATGYQSVPLPSGHPLSSDPAYEYDDNDSDDFHVGTLYWRSLKTIYQVSASNGVDQFNVSTLKAIPNPGTATMIGNPFVLGGVQYEAGHHWLLVRGSDGVYWNESVQDWMLSPN